MSLMREENSAGWNIDHVPASACYLPLVRIPLPVLRGPVSAGVRGQHLAEVVEAQGWPTWGGICQQQQSTIFGRRGATEGFLRSWNVGTAELPGTPLVRVAGGVDRVEVGTHWRIHAALTWIGIRGIRYVALARRNSIVLDARQICLKCYPAVSLRAVDEWAGEQDRSGIELIVRPWIAERSWPGVLVGHAIEIGIGESAPRYRDARRGGRAQAKDVVLTLVQGLIRIMHTVLGTIPRLNIDGVAVLEVPDLVRERDVVRVGRP